MNMVLHQFFTLKENNSKQAPLKMFKEKYRLTIRKNHLNTKALIYGTVSLSLGWTLHQSS